MFLSCGEPGVSCADGRVGEDQRGRGHLHRRGEPIVVSGDDLVDEATKRRQPRRCVVLLHHGAEEPVLVIERVLLPLRPRRFPLVPRLVTGTACARESAATLGMENGSRLETPGAAEGDVPSSPADLPDEIDTLPSEDAGDDHELHDVELMDAGAVGRTDMSDANEAWFW